MERKATTNVCIITLTVFIVISSFGFASKSSSEPYTSVKYRLYHFEDASWVEYTPNDSFPPGGNEPGTNLWKYEYIVYNWSAPQPIRQLYVFFNSENVSMDATWSADAAPEGWTATPIGPFEPDFNWKERFEASSSDYYISAPDSLNGFVVEFTWTRDYLPGSQLYDAIYSGGSESSMTHWIHEPTATIPTRWGTIKALYR